MHAPGMDNRTDRGHDSRGYKTLNGSSDDLADCHKRYRKWCEHVVARSRIELATKISRLKFLTRVLWHVVVPYPVTTGRASRRQGLSCAYLARIVRAWVSLKVAAV